MIVLELLLAGFAIGLASYLFDPDYSDWRWAVWIGQHWRALLACGGLCGLALASGFWLLYQQDLTQVNCAYSSFGCDIRPPISN